MRTFFLLISTTLLINSCSEPGDKQNIAKPIELTIESNEWSSLLLKRAEHLKKDVILSSKKDFVQAKLTYNNTTHNVKIRLKGDWTDHITGKYWSYRVHSKDTVLGMRRFNLHDPKLKGYTYQWLFFQACKREGIITPHTEYVWLSINGDTSLYQLEEHFDFLMLHRNKLPSWPIVRFDESMPWKNLSEGVKWTNTQDSIYFFNAPIDAFRSGTVDKDSLLNRQFQIAKKKLSDFRKGILSTHEVFHTPTLARYVALCDLFGGTHGLRWHNVRYYFNANDQLLYPIAFDNSAGNSNMTFTFELKGKNRYFMRLFFQDKIFKTNYHSVMARICSEQYIKKTLNKTHELHSEYCNLIQIKSPNYSFSESFLYENAARYRFMKQI